MTATIDDTETDACDTAVVTAIPTFAGTATVVGALAAGLVGYALVRPRRE